MECTLVLKIINLPCYIVFCLVQECTGNDEGKETEETKTGKKSKKLMTASSDVKFPEVRQFDFDIYFFYTKLSKGFGINLVSLDPDPAALQLNF